MAKPKSRCRHQALVHVIPAPGTPDNNIRVWLRGELHRPSSLVICVYCGSWRMTTDGAPGPWHKPRRAA